MIFTTWAFGAFAALALLAYHAVVPGRFKRHFLVIAGAAFYAYAVPAYLALVVCLGTIVYAAARAMLAASPQRRRPLLVAAVTLVTGVLAYFKYAHFIASIVAALTRQAIVPYPALTVPLAISFFTFEFVHVLADASAGKIRRLDSLDFATFALFFPTLVAGPIKRYETFAPQLHPLRRPSASATARDAYRIALGFAKKTIVADSMSAFTTPLIAPGGAFRSGDYAVAIVAYSVKIYFDFSGYSDIAIGLAGLLGVRVPENFRKPYRAANVAEFWRRWHVSLSSWIRDYVFVPLGGSRRSPPIVAANLLLAMTLAGLWHGAAWTFVAWGFWHGLGLVAHRTWRATIVPRVTRLRDGSLALRAASTAATLAFVAVGWVFFAAPSLPAALTVLHGLLL